MVLALWHSVKSVDAIYEHASILQMGNFPWSVFTCHTQSNIRVSKNDELCTFCLVIYLYHWVFYCGIVPTLPKSLLVPFNDYACECVYVFGESLWLIDRQTHLTRCSVPLSVIQLGFFLLMKILIYVSIIKCFYLFFICISELHMLWWEYMLNYQEQIITAECRVDI